MMIEPPGEKRRGRVLEVHDGILSAGIKPALLKQESGTVHQPAIVKPLHRPDTLSVKAREQRRRTRAIKTFIVIKDPTVQSCFPSLSPSLFRIAGGSGIVPPVHFKRKTRSPDEGPNSAGHEMAPGVL
jgi:hypothetical protein